MSPARSGSPSPADRSAAPVSSTHQEYKPGTSRPLLPPLTSSCGDRIRDESVSLLIKWEASASSSGCSGRGGTDTRGDADSGSQADARVWYDSTWRPDSRPVTG